MDRRVVISCGSSGSIARDIVQCRVCRVEREMIDEIYDGLTLLPRNYDSRNINSNIRIKFIRGNNWLGSLIFVKIVIINTKLFRRTYVLTTKKYGI